MYLSGGEGIADSLLTHFYWWWNEGVGCSCPLQRFKDYEHSRVGCWERGWYGSGLCWAWLSASAYANQLAVRWQWNQSKDWWESAISKQCHDKICSRCLPSRYWEVSTLKILGSVYRQTWLLVLLLCWTRTRHGRQQWNILRSLNPLHRYILQTTAYTAVKVDGLWWARLVVVWKISKWIRSAVL